jgi:hypothetical protein
MSTIELEFELSRVADRLEQLVLLAAAADAGPAPKWWREILGNARPPSLPALPEPPPDLAVMFADYAARQDGYGKAWSDRAPTLDEEELLARVYRERLIASQGNDLAVERAEFETQLAWSRFYALALRKALEP